MTPEQRAKLPMYAQVALQRLEHTINNQREDLLMLTVAAPRSSVTVGYTPKGRTLTFVPEGALSFWKEGQGPAEGLPTARVTWNAKTGALNVSGTNQLIIHPRVSNSIEILVAAR